MQLQGLCTIPSACKIADFRCVHKLEARHVLWFLIRMPSWKDEAESVILNWPEENPVHLRTQLCQTSGINQVRVSRVHNRRKIRIEWNWWVESENNVKRINRPAGGGGMPMVPGLRARLYAAAETPTIAASAITQVGNSFYNPTARMRELRNIPTQIAKLFPYSRAVSFFIVRTLTWQVRRTHSTPMFLFISFRSRQAREAPWQ